MRAALAILLANVPVRWWGPFEERYPLHRMAWLSGLVTMLSGVAIGIPGYLHFLQEAAHRFNAGIGADPDLGIKSSGIDAAARRIVGHEDRVRRERERLRLEGPATPDRLVTGASLGRADAKFVLLASRAKVDWERNAYLVTSEGRAYCIGRPFDVTLGAGLRTGYPLTELRTGEPIRHSIAYDLPPLWRDRKA